MREPSATNSLPNLLQGKRAEFHDPAAGRVSYYVNFPGQASTPSSPGADDPLLLVHSINAAASAHEVKPLYDAFSAQRPVYALDLPGYGFSDRSDRRYLPRLMVDAIHAMIARIRSDYPGRPIDGLAVSLSSEFLARAAHERPENLRSLALISSTGFRRNTPENGKPESNRGNRFAYQVFNLPIFGRALFYLLTTPPSIRFFLRKTWGSRDIDEQMFRDSCRTARQPGARHAPFHFLSGYLFSADILKVFDELTQPTWLAHGVKGDFTDYSRAEYFSLKPNWRVGVFKTGALPYFETPVEFHQRYSDFLAAAASGGLTNPSIS